MTFAEKFSARCTRLRYGLLAGQRSSERGRISITGGAVTTVVRDSFGIADDNPPPGAEDENEFDGPIVYESRNCSDVQSIFARAGEQRSKSFCVDAPELDCAAMGKALTTISCSADSPGVIPLTAELYESGNYTAATW